MRFQDEHLVALAMEVGLYSDDIVSMSSNFMDLAGAAFEAGTSVRDATISTTPVPVATATTCWVNGR
jgi:hypothetical protein